uniref:WW domain binding protein VOPP1 n=1 Tax=Cyprinus carpio TaxID=7962 RepID=A0A8C2HED7_CYPCA
KLLVSHLLINRAVLTSYSRFLRRCRSYEDCCGTQLLFCIFTLSGFFIRRRMYPSALSEEPAFNVSFTRHPVSSPGERSLQPGMQGYGDPCSTMTTTLTPVYPGQPAPSHMLSSYPPPPSYCSHPPPSYEQVFKNAEKKNHSQSSQ